MVVMSDFTNEQLKAIVAFGIDTIKKELKERLEIEDKENFPIKVDDYFLNEYEQCVYHIINVTHSIIYYEFAQINKNSIVSSRNSYDYRDSHDFNSMVRIDKETFDKIQKIIKDYEIKSNELKLSSIKSANNIISSIEK